MTVRDFRKLLHGANPDAELAFVFENRDVTMSRNFVAQAVVEQNATDSDGKKTPYVLIVYRECQIPPDIDRSD